MNNSGGFTNDGIVELFDGGTINNNAGGVIDNNGKISIQSTGTLNNNDGSTLTNNDTLIINIGTLNNNNDGTLTNNDILIVKGDFTNDGTLINPGTIIAISPDGKTGDKILVCHNGKKTLSILSDSVDDHLIHGDSTGSCKDSKKD